MPRVTRASMRSSVAWPRDRRLQCRRLCCTGRMTACHYRVATRVTWNSFRQRQRGTLWLTLAISCHANSPVLHDGHVYGLNDGQLECVDLKTGRVVWKDDRRPRRGEGFGHGGLLLTVFSQDVQRSATRTPRLHKRKRPLTQLRHTRGCEARQPWPYGYRSLRKAHGSCRSDDAPGQLVTAGNAQAFRAERGRVLRPTCQHRGLADLCEVRGVEAADRPRADDEHALDHAAAPTGICRRSSGIRDSLRLPPPASTRKLSSRRRPPPPGQ